MAVAMTLCASMLALLPAPPVGAAPAAVFDPLPTSTAVEAGVYSTVVADGAGRYHSVMRTDGARQAIEYRRSTDGGRTWVAGGSWTGQPDGGTRPAIAVDGDVVAIVYIGSYCVPPAGACGQAPYLVRSTDGGRSFSNPLRLYDVAFNVSVGVDGPRTWVAWHGRNNQNDDVVVMRGYGTDGRMFAERVVAGSQPTVTAGGGGGVITFVREGIGDGEEGMRFARAQLLDAQGFGAVDEHPFDDDPGTPGMPIDAASAAGRVHLLYGWTLTGPTTYTVRTADIATGSFGAPVPALTGTGGSLAARKGLVAVAAIDPATGATSVVRSANGSAFGAPIVASRTAGGAYHVELAVAALPTWRPSAVFGWSVAPRYTDRDSDGYPDPANSGVATPIDAAINEVEVTLDGCGSKPGGGDRIATFAWTISDAEVTTNECRITRDLPLGQAAAVSLTVTDDKGYTDTRSIDVTPKDHLVVSLGDSVASGEGNPHVDSPSEAWEDGPCHRTHFAGPALAARQLEEADPHSSVTFVQLSCSGAAIMDVPAVPGQALEGDDPNTGGILDGYHGVEPDGSGARPSQLAQLSALIGDRTPDAVTISIGANDVVFSDVLKACLVGACLEDGTKAVLDQRLADLPRRYEALGSALSDLGVPDGAVFLSEYYDVASNSLGLSDLRCVANAENEALVGALVSARPEVGALVWAAAVLGEGLVTDDEAAWSKDYLGARINEAVRAGAQAQGWKVVGGFDTAFARHGLCADDPWVVTVPQSLITQNDEYGSFHPNRAGHAEYGRRLGVALTRALVEPSPLDPDAPPTGPAVGDVYLLTHSPTQITVASMRDEGATLAPLTQRRVDRVISGEGYVSAGGPPAADPSSAVVSWTQLTQGSVLSWRSLLAQVSLVENVRVSSVSFSQAAEGARTLVIGRPTVVLARVQFDGVEEKLLNVTTVVTDQDGDSVLDVTEEVTLRPGFQFLGLPAKATFEPEEGKSYSAQVTIDDPLSANRASAADNSAEVAADAFPELVPTRSLSFIDLPLRPSEQPAIACERVTFSAFGALRAEGMMPAEVRGQQACNEVGPYETTRRGAAAALSTLDYLARLTAQDSVVGVAPDGWLMDAYPNSGTLGVANLGGRGIVLNRDAPKRTLAHEMTHNLGYEHVDRPANGIWVAERRTYVTRDFMAPIDGEQWVSPQLWDGLTETIGGPEKAPQLPDPSAPGLWVRGDVVQNDEGEWVPLPGRWVPAGTTETSDPRLTDPELLEQLDLQRVVVRQVDGAGNPVADEQQIPLGSIGGLYAPGSTPPTEPLGHAYAGLVTPVSGATAIQIVLDGQVVEERKVNGPPVITAVTAPAAGASASRGASLEVAWEAADPDRDPLTTDLLVSGDGGTTWEPLAVDVGASPATVTVPADLDGDDVRIRVVVSDGVRMTTADSEPFSVGGATFEVRDRVVFQRSAAADYGKTVERLSTMEPSGGPAVEVGLPRTMSWDTEEVPDEEGGTSTIGYSCRDPQGDGTCLARYWYPSWAPDGARLHFSSDLVDTRFGGAAVPGVRDYVSFHIWSSAADGSDLRRITTPQPIQSSYPQGNFCPDASRERVVWAGGGGTDYSSLYSAALDGSGMTKLISTLGPAEQSDKSLWPRFDGSGWNPDATTLSFTLVPGWGDLGDDPLLYSTCPRVSPDGDSVAFIARAGQDGAPYEQSTPVVVMGIDGSDPRIVTDRFERFGSVDWIDDDRLVATKVENLGFQGEDFEAVELELTSTRPARRTLASWLGGEGPQTVRSAPGELLYGAKPNYGTFPRDFDLATIDPSGVIAVTPDAARDRGFDWTRSSLPGGPDVPVVAPPVVEMPKADAGGPYSATAGVAVTLTAGGSILAGDPIATVAWDIDDDGQFDDADGRNPEVVFAEGGTVPVRVRVTPGSGSPSTSEKSSVTVLAAPDPEFEVDPGAEGTPQKPAGPTPLRVSVPAGVPTEVRLGPDRAAGPFVVTAFEGDVLRVGSGVGAPTLPGLATTGATGSIRVTADPAFRGSTRFTYAHPDDLTRTETVEIEVTGNAAPAATDDTIDVDAGVRRDLSPADLLANDADPDGDPGGLQVVSVVGMTDGQAWLSADGDLVTVIPGATTGTFAYTIADPQGGLDTGSVSVRVRPTGGAGPTTPPTTPPPVPPTAPTTTSAPAVTEPRPGVVPPVEASTKKVTLTHRVYFRFESTKLTKAQKRALRAFAAQIPEGATVETRSVGVVRVGGTKADKRRALKRARTVRAYLISRGLPGEITVSNSARTASSKPSARRVHVLVTYTVAR